MLMKPSALIVLNSGIICKYLKKTAESDSFVLQASEFLQ